MSGEFLSLPVHPAPTRPWDPLNRGRGAKPNAVVALVAFVVRAVWRGSVEYRFLLFLKAVGAKAMRWFSAGVLLLERIHENTGSRFVKLVTSRLRGPAIVAGDLLFEGVFCLGHLLILSLQAKHLGLHVDEAALKISNGFGRLGVVGRIDCLSDYVDGFAQCFEAEKQRSEVHEAKADKVEAEKQGGQG